MSNIFDMAGGDHRTLAEKRIEDLVTQNEKLREALREYENADNWFDTSDEAGGPYPAWRGNGEPEEIAARALKIGGNNDEEL